MSTALTVLAWLAAVFVACSLAAAGVAVYRNHRDRKDQP